MTYEEIIEKTKELVKIESTIDNQKGLWTAVDAYQALLTDKRITIERFEQNNVPSFLAYIGPKRPEQFDVLFNAHVDSVVGRPEEFIPRIEGNRFYGRGVYDMKMAALIMTDVFRRFAPTSNMVFGLQIVSDEEVGGYDGVKIQLEQGVATDFVISGEMTDLGVCNETRGVCWVEVGFKGRSAHSGYAWDGHNAVTRASDFVRALGDKFPIPEKKAWVTTANIAAVTTNNATFNRVPDVAQVKVDFRFIPEDPHFKDEQSIHDFIKTLDPTADVLNIPVFDQAVYVEPQNPYLLEFLHSFAEATGQVPTPIKRYASSDMRHFAQRHMSAIEFGLRGKNLHADNEYVDLTSVMPFKDTLEHFIHNMARKKSQHLDKRTPTTFAR
ncbi:MAG TPA: M20/M25/M40 family metallo-hydrolase [Magnetospirillaceae bacterium]|nr:M20/M25/M40 family metallo-hydrolase [Magnetospirillaceae bacterium]